MVTHNELKIIVLIPIKQTLSGQNGPLIAKQSAQEIQRENI